MIVEAGSVKLDRYVPTLFVDRPLGRDGEGLLRRVIGQRDPKTVLAVRVDESGAWVHVVDDPPKVVDGELASRWEAVR